MHRRSGFEIIARLGYVARGLVHVVVGGFAVLAAIAGERAVGTKGALQKLLTQPLGTALLCVVTLGSFASQRGAWRSASSMPTAVQKRPLSFARPHLVPQPAPSGKSLPTMSRPVRGAGQS
jgi:Domain of Unknown Function (DUF1206)